jgi:serine O-acetyltransferase
MSWHRAVKEPFIMDNTNVQPMQFRTMFRLIREDLESHRNDWTAPGFHAIAVHRFGCWRMQLKSRALRMPLSALYKGAFTFVRNFYGIELPYTAKVGRRVVIEHQGNIVVHGACELGDGTILRQGVTLGIRHLHRLDDAPKVGRDVNIGAGAVVLGNITVGDGATIGANSVVTHDVRSGAVVVGAPAREVERVQEGVRRKPVHEKPTKRPTAFRIVRS